MSEPWESFPSGGVDDLLSPMGRSARDDAAMLQQQQQFALMQLQQQQQQQQHQHHAQSHHGQSSGASFLRVEDAPPPSNAAATAGGLLLSYPPLPNPTTDLSLGAPYFPSTMSDSGAAGGAPASAETMARSSQLLALLSSTGSGRHAGASAGADGGAPTLQQQIDYLQAMLNAEMRSEEMTQLQSQEAQLRDKLQRVQANMAALQADRALQTQLAHPHPHAHPPPTNYQLSSPAPLEEYEVGDDGVHKKARFEEVVEDERVRALATPLPLPLPSLSLPSISRFNSVTANFNPDDLFATLPDHTQQMDQDAAGAGPGAATTAASSSLPAALFPQPNDAYPIGGGALAPVYSSNLQRGNSTGSGGGNGAPNEEPSPLARRLSKIFYNNFKSLNALACWGTQYAGGIMSDFAVQQNFAAIAALLVDEERAKLVADFESCAGVGPCSSASPAHPSLYLPLVYAKRPFIDGLLLSPAEAIEDEMDGVARFTIGLVSPGSGNEGRKRKKSVEHQHDTVNSPSEPPPVPATATAAAAAAASTCQAPSPAHSSASAPISASTSPTPSTSSSASAMAPAQDHGVLQVNKTWERLTGYSQRDMVVNLHERGSVAIIPLLYRPDCIPAAHRITLLCRMNRVARGQHYVVVRTKVNRKQIVDEQGWRWGTWMGSRAHLVVFSVCSLSFLSLSSFLFFFFSVDSFFFLSLFLSDWF